MRQDLVLASLLAGMGVAVLPGALAFSLAAGPSMWLATGAAVAAIGLRVLRRGAPGVICRSRAPQARSGAQPVSARRDTPPP